MIWATIEVVSNYYKQSFPPKNSRGKRSKGNLILFILLRDINKLSCVEIGELTNRERTTITKLQSKANKLLIKDILFKKEYNILTELIRQHGHNI